MFTLLLNTWTFNCFKPLNHHLKISLISHIWTLKWDLPFHIILLDVKIDVFVFRSNWFVCSNSPPFHLHSSNVNRFWHLRSPILWFYYQISRFIIIIDCMSILRRGTFPDCKSFDRNFWGPIVWHCWPEAWTCDENNPHKTNCFNARMNKQWKIFESEKRDFGSEQFVFREIFGFIKFCGEGLKIKLDYRGTYF